MVDSRAMSSMAVLLGEAQAMLKRNARENQAQNGRANFVQFLCTLLLPRILLIPDAKRKCLPLGIPPSEERYVGVLFRGTLLELVPCLLPDDGEFGSLHITLIAELKNLFRLLRSRPPGAPRLDRLFVASWPRRRWLHWSRRHATTQHVP